jgi:nitrogen fixation/metabolism regulation signal transduction histidine kinase
MRWRPGFKVASDADLHGDRAGRRSLRGAGCGAHQDPHDVSSVRVRNELIRQGAILGAWRQCNQACRWMESGLLEIAHYRACLPFRLLPYPYRHREGPRTVLYRTVALLSVGWVLVTGVLLTFLVATSWIGAGRLEQVSQHLTFTLALEAERDALADAYRKQDSRRLTQHAENLADLAPADASFSQTAADLLKSAAVMFERVASTESWADASEMDSTVRGAFSLVQQALQLGMAAEKARFGELSDFRERELLIVVILALIIPASTLAVLILFRRRVLLPLRDLEYLIGLLSRRDYDAAVMDRVDSLMAPLFDKYNRMVKRMRDLDRGHAKREGVLRQDVDEATRALVQQQAALAGADRMAVVGELLARLAHDLRNPLSGALMALTNLREEVNSAEHTERLTTVISELERIAHIFSDIVNESRLPPERPQCLQLSRVVNDVVKLLRYQLSSSIAVTTNVPGDIYCRLPDAGFRRVLRNLVLNAAQAIGERPGAIEIAAAVGDGHAELTIRDGGFGFPEELLAAEIHAYGSWRNGGVGFGLAAARRFAREQGIHLDLRNKPEGGANVILGIPVEACADSSAEAPEV